MSCDVRSSGAAPPPLRPQSGSNRCPFDRASLKPSQSALKHLATAGLSGATSCRGITVSFPVHLLNALGVLTGIVYCCL